MSCPVCKSTALASAGTAPDTDGLRGDLEMRRCTSCGLVFVADALTDTELAAYYPDAFYGTGGDAVGIAARVFLKLRVRLIERAGVRAGRAFDVGCGEGGFLAALRDRGFAVSGLEPSAAGRARCEARGLDVVEGWDSATDGPFDVITSWHALEHTREPVELLRRMRERLSPDGVALVAVPNFGSLESQVFGNSWFHLDVPRHQLHFTERSLTTALHRADLEPFDVVYFSPEYNPFGLLQSVGNVLGAEKNALYRWLKRGQPMSGFDRKTRAVVAATLAGLPITAPAALLADVALARLGKSATLTALARRR